MIITIHGPDGSGKSTLADMIVAELEMRGIVARHYPFRFGVLPPLSALRGGRRGAVHKPRQNTDHEDSGASKDPVYDLSENTALRTFAYMCWYGTDYMLGGITLRLRNIFGRKKHVAVFARYFYDYYYQSNNRRLSMPIKRMIEVLVPRPQFIFFLDRDAQEIHDGKPELPVEEIAKQQQIIRERLSIYPQFREVDARAGAEATARAILHYLQGLPGA